MPMNKKCQICGKKDLTEYVDGKLKRGPWGNMCLPCFQLHGVGLGQGLGQWYKFVAGKYIKVKG